MHVKTTVMNCSSLLRILLRILAAARWRVRRFLHHRVVSAPEQKRFLMLAAFRARLRDSGFDLRIAIRRYLSQLCSLSGLSRGKSDCSTRALNFRP